MPATINGIGTSYVGKKNRDKRLGVCEHCHLQVELISYDTWLCITVIYLPVIPLGRRRIIDECSSCRMHRAMPLDEYYEYQTETLAEMKALWERNPGNFDTAIRDNLALMQFRQGEEATVHLSQMLEGFPENVECLMHAGWVYEELCLKEAKGFFERAYDLDPQHAAARGAKAYYLIVDGDLRNAEKLLREASARERDPAVVYRLAQGYQEACEHRSALSVYRLLLEDHPDYEQDNEVRASIKRSEKLVPGIQSILPPKPIPRWAIAAAVFLLLVVGGVSAWSEHAKRNFPVHILNGYPGPVEIVLDGEQALSFEDYGRLEIMLPEGDHQVEVLSPWQENFTFTVQRSYVERLLEDPPVAIVNPGGLGVVLWEETLYSTEPAPDFEMPTRLYAGENFFLLRKIDFPFAGFPDEIDTKERKVRKRRVEEFFLNPEEGYGWFYAQQPDVGLAFLESWFALEAPDTLAEPYATMALLAGEESRGESYLKNLLTYEPVNVQWHRAYQNLAERLPSSRRALRAKYDYLLQSDENPDLLYLRGRMDQDSYESGQFYRRALAVDDQHFYTLRALGYLDLTLGRFETAVESLGRSVAISPEDFETRHLFHSALYAAGRVAEVEERLLRTLDESAALLDWDSAELLVHVLIGRGDPAAAEELIARIGERDAALPPEEQTGIATWMKAEYLYATESWEALGKLVHDPRFPASLRPTLQLWVMSGTDANRPGEGTILPEAGAYHRLLHGLAVARRIGIDRLTGGWFVQQREVIDELAETDESFRAFAELWNAKNPPTRLSLNRLDVLPEVKRVLLTALALRFPEQRSELFEQARMFNKEHSFPYHLVKELGG